MQPIVSIRAPARGATHPRNLPAPCRAGFDPRPRTGGDRRRPLINNRPTRFRSAPPHGGRLRTAAARVNDLAVSIRAPARGATISSFSPPMHMTVSIRAPARGATMAPRVSGSWPEFRSAPPHGGRPLHCPEDKALWPFRSAPPHGGRQMAGKGKPLTKEVSIRAPARGATLNRSHGIGQGIVSIRAPARGATLSCRGSRHRKTGFDPRPRTGGDAPSLVYPVEVIVSIRAPARGATITLALGKVQRQFRSAPPHGGRRGLVGAEREAAPFRSAPPHGGRRMVRQLRGDAR